jgi:hypothetical protein
MSNKRLKLGDSVEERSAYVDEELLKHSFNQDLIPLEARQNKYKAITDKNLDPIQPFAFYRATAHLYWKDFGNSETMKKYPADCWLLGDAHVSNIGAFQNAVGDAIDDPTKNEIIFDLNDFDEAVFSDFKFDVWRMAISIVLVLDGLREKAKESDKPDFDVEAAVTSFISAYLKCVRSPNTFIEEDCPSFSKFMRKLEDKKLDARTDTINKWTKDDDHEIFNLELVDKEYGTKRLKVPGNKAKKEIKNILKKYFKVNDVAIRLGAGIGSQGLMRYYGLVNNDSILDIKQQPEPSASLAFPSRDVFNPFNGTRVIHGTRKLLRETDWPKHLGTIRISNEALIDEGVKGLPENGFSDFSVRELNISKKSLDFVEDFKKKDILRMPSRWGSILGNGHRRSSPLFVEAIKNQPADFESEFTRLSIDVAKEYAAQVNSDFLSFSTSATISQSLQ